MADNRPGDILGQNSGEDNNKDTSSKTNKTNNTNSSSSVNKSQDTELLRSIDKTLKSILYNSNMSQSAARSSMPGGQRQANKWQPNREDRTDSKSGKDSRNSRDYRAEDFDFSFDSVLDDFTEGLESALVKSIVGDDFKKKLNSVMSNFAQAAGVNVKDIPKKLGEQLGKNILDKTGLGQAGKNTFNKTTSALKGKFMSGVEGYANKKGINPEDAVRTFTDMFKGKANPAQDSQAEAAAAQAAQAGEDSFIYPVDESTSLFSDSVNIYTEAVIQFAEAVDRFNESKSSNKGKDTKQSDEDDGELAEEGDEASKVNNPLDELKSKLKDRLQPDVDDLKGKGKDALGDASTLSEVGEGVEGAGMAEEAGAGLETLLSSEEILGASLAGLGEAAAMAVPYIAAAGLALAALDKLFDQFAPAIEGAKKLMEGMSNAANRYQKSREQNLKESEKRIEADVKTMAEEPFKILKEAAQNLYDAWDNNIRTINQTQGYSKDDLYALMGKYAERLREDNLTSVVSTADIMNNLSRVLEAGLSNDVAVEFAYLATKLNAAVPTQDFFEYASTYSSLAATAIKNGQSQSEAISYANQQLEQFASDLLYTGRELTGGFSTGLTNASKLFQDAVKISQAAKTDNTTEIAGVLTSVSGIIGELAPDLAGELVDKVVSAAVGGNSNELVALRSLSGKNASNTEFLKMLAENPQQLFSDIFYNLSRYQNMAPDAYMEAAEGLSETFGISMDALSRVDFNYLAAAVSEMNTNSNTLNDNIQLLASGQSTTTAEQLRMEQVNKYMLDEGLAYVMDNAAARSIQEHMWDEQLAREIQENMYAVELQGSALEFLEGIKQTVDNITNFISPIGWLKKIGNLTATAVEGVAQSADLKQMLELGKVGNESARDLYNLTTTNQDLHLTSKLVDLMGGVSAYGLTSAGLKAFNTLISRSSLRVLGDVRSAGKSALSALLQNKFTANASNNVNSQYKWAVVSKSQAQAFQNSKQSAGYTPDAQLLPSASNKAATTANIQSKSKQNFQNYLDSMKTYISDAQKAGKRYSYDDWKATSTKYGIKDVDSAMKSYGVSENDLQSQFMSQEAAAGQEYEHEREQREDEFWLQGTSYFLNTQESWLAWQTLVNDNQLEEITQLKTVNSNLVTIQEALGDQLEDQQETLEKVYIKNLTDLLNGASDGASVYNQLKDFIGKWEKYYITHTAYNSSTRDAYKTYTDTKHNQKSKEENANDAILSLAQKLLDNTTDAQDPVLQSNLLLAKILLVVEAIMQQNNDVDNLSIPDALSALSLGMLDVTGTKKKK